MSHPALPPRAELVRAYLDSDTSYEGVFVTAVRTTGIFCRPSCPARKPRPENVEFFAAAREALAAGYRPCKRCRPLAPLGDAPDWLAPLLDRIDENPTKAWKDADLRALGLEPARVARWFKNTHGMTFHAYSRARRLGRALGHLHTGGRVTDAAYAAGYESLSAFSDAFRQFAGQTPTGAQSTERVWIDRIETPLGPLVVGATASALVLLEFTDRRMLPTQVQRISRIFRCAFVPGRTEVLDELDRQLTAYFAGARRTFDIPIDAPGTDFQRLVWSALREIPVGTTCSYQELAARIGRPTAVRAVARANGDNRIAILIPCHRVIGADGQLTGYGGGLWRKQRLLELEGAVTPELALSSDRESRASAPRASTGRR